MHSVQIRQHMWVFVNSLIENPAFDAQTKEELITQAKAFGSKCEMSEDFYKKVEKIGIVEACLQWVRAKQMVSVLIDNFHAEANCLAQVEMDKKSGKKATRIKGVPKLEDANEAGTKNALKCTLILTEGACGGLD